MRYFFFSFLVDDDDDLVAVLLPRRVGGLGGAVVVCVMVVFDRIILVLPSHNVPFGGSDVQPSRLANRFLMGKDEFVVVTNILG